MKRTTLGILGGLGPMSGVYFCQLLIEHTQAGSDRDHLNFLLSSRADTPDRTDFILGRSQADPAPVMEQEVQRLIAAGAEIIAIPCNTAHYFYERIARASSVPVLNIIEETVRFCAAHAISSVGVLATEGTVASGAYARVCRQYGVKYLTCNEQEQAQITHMIYQQIKQGEMPDPAAFAQIADGLLRRGADAVILGCTELSLLKKAAGDPPNWIDSLEVLAYRAICLCGGVPKGFDERLMQDKPGKGNDDAVK